MQTIIVTDAPEHWEFLSSLAFIVHASNYLADSQYHQSQSLRVINLCHGYHYQTIGYYVSLLAQARDHKAIPSILSIQDSLHTQLSKQISEDIDDEIQHSLQTTESSECTLYAYFGLNPDKKFASLTKKLHGLFPLPLICFTFQKKKRWTIKALSLLSSPEIPSPHIDFMQQAATAYLTKKRFQPGLRKPRTHHLAILIDSAAQHAPSNPKALELFASAGEAIGLHVDFIDKHSIKTITEYDALFIRATTAVDHFTYRFARRAFQENLIVIDDPQSIVKCSNKVYLAELMRNHQIPTPDTVFISKYDKILPNIEYPCVLKKPDGAFSKGVIKLNNQSELEKSLKQFFKTSDLVIIQPFIPTAFDWRIGVLDNKPLFASRYYMADGHWQIYNWKATADIEGADESVPLNEVPKDVIKTALKASRLIGDGLYGVDLKSYGDKHYVIEINDNPSLDHGVEDQLLGEALYQQIMAVFLKRIQKNLAYPSVSLTS